MPGFDQTGPQGAGPMTGGAMGLCNPANSGYNPRFTEGSLYGRGLGGRGLGLKRGFRGGFVPDQGRGRRRGFDRGYGGYPPGPAYPAGASDEIDMLKADADYMQKSLDVINRRIEELGKKPSISS